MSPIKVRFANPKIKVSFPINQVIGTGGSTYTLTGQKMLDESADTGNIDFSINGNGDFQGDLTANSFLDLVDQGNSNVTFTLSEEFFRANVDVLNELEVFFDSDNSNVQYDLYGDGFTLNYDDLVDDFVAAVDPASTVTATKVSDKILLNASVTGWIPTDFINQSNALSEYVMQRHGAYFMHAKDTACLLKSDLTACAIGDNIEYIVFHPYYIFRNVGTPATMLQDANGDKYINVLANSAYVICGSGMPVSAGQIFFMGLQVDSYTSGTRVIMTGNILDQINSLVRLTSATAVECGGISAAIPSGQLTGGTKRMFSSFLEGAAAQVQRYYVDKMPNGAQTAAFTARRTSGQTYIQRLFSIPNFAPGASGSLFGPGKIYFIGALQDVQAAITSTTVTTYPANMLTNIETQLRENYTLP